jgi:protein transport protein SEC24
MSDHATYHAMGHPSEPGDDPRTHQTGTYPQSQTGLEGSFPQQAYQQMGSPYGGNTPAAGSAPSQYSGQYPGNFLAHSGTDPVVGLSPSPLSPETGAIGGLAAQMGGLGISGEPTARSHKKKARHAYHDIGAAPSSQQAWNDAPQPNAPAASQFLSTGMNPQPPLVGPPQIGQYTPALANPALGASTQPNFHSAGADSVPTQGKIDPEQIPSVPRSRDVPSQYYRNHVYPTMERHLPPPAAIPLVVSDQGNSSPKYARLTLNNIPSTSDFLQSTGLPLGMILQPLAQPDSGERPIPIIDFGDAGPPRCRRCRTYINPFMVFRSGGNKFVCNMCTFPNDVPPEYYAPVEPSGVRVDRMQRPELMMGTVEFLVPKEYWNKHPVGLRWLFLIDVSQEAINRGLLAGVCDGIMNALYSEDNDVQTDEDNPVSRNIPEGSTVGIVTYDKEVHFYNLSVS